MNETTTGHAWTDGRCVNCGTEKPRPWAEPCPNVEDGRTVGDVLASFVQSADPALAAHLRAAARAPLGCCHACNGKGGTAEGACSDCLGTGCAHADPCLVQPATPEGDPA